MSAQPMDESLNGWLLEMTQIGRGLPGFMAHGLHTWVSQTEGIYHHFTWEGGRERGRGRVGKVGQSGGRERGKGGREVWSTFNTLNGVYYHGNCPSGQGLEALLSINIHTRQPAAKTRVGMVPGGTEQERSEIQVGDGRGCPERCPDLRGYTVQHTRMHAHRETYHPTTISGRPVCFSMSSILAWNTGSTASTLTPFGQEHDTAV